MNPLYQQLNNSPSMGNLINKFQQFKQTFSGNPQQIVQQMLSSGKISQEQYNQAVQMANQFQQFLK
jgi:hypothetical protein